MMGKNKVAPTVSHAVRPPKSLSEAVARGFRASYDLLAEAITLGFAFGFAGGLHWLVGWLYDGATGYPEYLLRAADLAVGVTLVLPRVTKALLEVFGMVRSIIREVAMLPGAWKEGRHALADSEAPHGTEQ